MGFPKSVAIKYGTFTLCYRKLLDHLPILSEAVRGDMRLTERKCIDNFDASMEWFCNNADPSDLVDAAEILGERLNSCARAFRRRNPGVASVFDHIIEAMMEAAPTWRYEEDIEVYHQQGRELARLFYENTPWKETQERLDKEASLIFVYGLPDEGDMASLRGEAFGYKTAPIGYRPSYKDEDTGEVLKDIIIVRFLFNYDFKVYLAYPFWFFHEYTAHIYALDRDNVCFNDGWMLHAAHVFLWRKWVLSEELAYLKREQAEVFYEHLYPELNPIPRRGCAFAKHFESWLSEWAPERFEEMTWELAAFCPQPGESDFFPTQFINALEREFEADRATLRRKIEASSDIRELWSMLTPL